MSTNPYESSETVGSPPGLNTYLTKLGLWLLVAVGILALLVALLLPLSRGGAQDAAHRMRCRNNLSQIALALQNYESTYHCLPPACTVDEAGKPLHSWRTLILPFLEQKALYDQIDLSKPWDDPANQAASEAGPSVYSCPRLNAAGEKTTYLAVVAPGGCFKPTEPRALAEITDNRHRTLMVIEVADEHAVHWMSPNDASEELILNLVNTRRSPHPRGAMAACVSGDIPWLRRTLSPAVLRALISIAGNDDDIAQEVR